VKTDSGVSCPPHTYNPSDDTCCPKYVVQTVFDRISWACKAMPLNSAPNGATWNITAAYVESYVKDWFQ
jgi:hypothetical protein